MTLAECVIKTVFDVDDQSRRETEGTVRKVASFAKKALGVIGIGFSIAGIAGLAEAKADANADANALESQFSQVFGGMEQEAKQALGQIADDTKIMEGRMKGSFSGIAAFAKVSGLETADALDLARRAMVASADSSAYYDRSIEDTVESLKSFLKGNFENDAALGLSCTETTRNAAANRLYQKSFIELSEAEKQFTLLSMVEEANVLSGALGQASRESDTWTNHLGNMKQSIKDLKADAGGLFLKPATDSVRLFSEIVRIAGRWVRGLSNDNSILVKGYEAFSDTVAGAVEQLGGLENVMKLVAVAAAGLGISFGISKIPALIGGIGGIKGALTALGKIFTVAKLKAAALFGAVTLILLIMEDYVRFMRGDNSMLGTLFEKAGIDAEAARERLLAIWDSVKSNLLYVWNAIKQAGKTASEALRKFWSANGENILSAIGYVVLSIIEMCTHLSAAISNFVAFVAAVLSGDWVSAWQFARQFFEEILSAILAWWNNLPEGIRAKIVEIVSNIRNGLQEAIDWLRSLPEQARQWGADFIDGLAAGIQEKIDLVVEKVRGLGERIRGLIHFSRPDEGPLRDYEDWMPDFMHGLAAGIEANAPDVLSVIGKLTDGMAGLSRLAGKNQANPQTTASMVRNLNRSIVQNVNITNTYSGSNDTQKTASKAMKKSAKDATTQMADALKYA